MVPFNNGDSTCNCFMHLCTQRHTCVLIFFLSFSGESENEQAHSRSIYWEAFKAAFSAVKSDHPRVWNWEDPTRHYNRLGIFNHFWLSLCTAMYLHVSYPTLCVLRPLTNSLNGYKAFASIVYAIPKCTSAEDVANPVWSTWRPAATGKSCRNSGSQATSQNTGEFDMGHPIWLLHLSKCATFMSSYS